MKKIVSFKRILIMIIIIKTARCENISKIPSTTDISTTEDNYLDVKYNKSFESVPQSTLNVTTTPINKTFTKILSTSNSMRPTKQFSRPFKNPFITPANLIDLQYCRMMIESTTEATSAMTEPPILAATEPITTTTLNEVTTEIETKMPETTSTTFVVEPKAGTLSSTTGSFSHPTRPDKVTKNFSTSHMPTTSSTTTTELLTPMKVVISDDATFLKVGTYRGSNESNEYQKTYFIPQRFRGDWLTAKVTCKAFEMELATFETLNEFTSFQQLWEDSQFSKYFKTTFYLHVDGITKTPKSPDDWYFTKNGRKVPFKMPWLTGEPSFAKNIEYCLSIGKKTLTDLLQFNDTICYSNRSVYHFNSFVCQKVDFVF